MWISKKKWEEIEEYNNGLNFRICVLEKEMSSIMRVHNTKVIDEEITVDNYNNPITRTKKVYESKGHTINTDKISDITLEELARFVIDKTPIERKEEIVKKYENK